MELIASIGIFDRKPGVFRVPFVPNGCKEHDDCFSCSEEDCTWGDKDKTGVRKQKKDNGKRLEVERLIRHNSELAELGERLLSLREIGKITGYSESGIRKIRRMAKGLTQEGKGSKIRKGINKEDCIERPTVLLSTRL